MAVKVENLVSMRAGKMYLKGDMVHPDKRKGLIYLYKSEDGLVHFCWKDRTSGTQEDDLILFPDDVEIKKLDACTTGRAYLLKIKSGLAKHFYWMQEPKSEKDEENWNKIMEIVNGEDADYESGTFAGKDNPFGGLGGMNENDIQSFLGGMNRNQIMQLLSSNFGAPGGGAGSLFGGLNNANLPAANIPKNSGNNAANSSLFGAIQSGNANNSTTQTSSGGTAVSNNKIELKMLQSALANITGKSDSSANEQTTLNAQQQEKVADVSPLIKADLINEVCNNESNVKALLQFLPDKIDLTVSDQEYIKQNLTSPQFKQAFRIFAQAFQSGQLSALIQSFGYKDKILDATNNGDWLKFLQALETQYKNVANKKEKKSETSTSTEKVKEPEDPKNSNL